MKKKKNDIHKKEKKQNQIVFHDTHNGIDR